MRRGALHPGQHRFLQMDSPPESDFGCLSRESAPPHLNTRAEPMSPTRLMRDSSGTDLPLPIRARPEQVARRAPKARARRELAVRPQAGSRLEHLVEALVQHLGRPLGPDLG